MRKWIDIDDESTPNRKCRQIAVAAQRHAFRLGGHVRTFSSPLGNVFIFLLPLVCWVVVSLLVFLWHEFTEIGVAVLVGLVVSVLAGFLWWPLLPYLHTRLPCGKKFVRESPGPLYMRVQEKSIRGSKKTAIRIKIEDHAKGDQVEYQQAAKFRSAVMKRVLEDIKEPVVRIELAYTPASDRLVCRYKKLICALDGSYGWRVESLSEGQGWFCNRTDVVLTKEAYEDQPTQLLPETECSDFEVES